MTIENAIRRLEDSEQELSYSQRLAIATLLRAFTLDCYIKDEWIDVNEELPKPMHNVLVYYKNTCDKGRIVKAIYVEPYTVLADDFYEDWDEEFCDYSYAEGEYYVKSGWYESVENDEYGYHPISDEILFWRPMPEEPLS